MLVLVAGIVVLFIKKVPGIIMILVAIYFLYVIPYQWKKEFKENTLGRYYSDSDKLLIIYENETYAIYQDSIRLDTSKVDYIYIDNGYVETRGKIHLEMTSYGDFVNKKERGEVFYRMN